MLFRLITLEPCRYHFDGIEITRKIPYLIYTALEAFYAQEHEKTVVFLQVENVRLMTKHGKKKAATGTLYLTATHLIFVDPDCSKETWVG